MSRIYRIISTILIVAGLAFLCCYFVDQSAGSKLELLNRPSYYVVQNYWYVFLAGIIVLVFSLIGSFFSWFKVIEEKEEVLPNAGYASKKDITDWVGGTSLDTIQKTVYESDSVNNSSDENLNGEVTVDEATEILGEEPTEILSIDETEIIESDDQTEILEEVQEVEK